ncbi:MAG: glutathione S-transferase family protein [Myxococcota bacterium]|nr:glutathione S-transferase family protein [Myxococcota bacterium]
MNRKLIGIGLSPYVRKVRVVLAEKGLEYDHEPMMPMGVPDEYKAKHPQGRIPVYEEDGKIIPDSSAISLYLEKTVPEPALYPTDPYELARAVWYEEFADDGIVKGTAALFQENFLARAFFQREPDQARIDEALNETLPPFFDYLENALGDDDYLVGNRYSIADIGVGTQFVNFAHGQGTIDAGRWPKLAAYIERIHSRPSFKGLIEEERAMAPS